MTDDFDADVVVVGGGPTGCSAGVYTARGGLETIVFDRGPSSLRRCASLENYLGFPAVDVETFLQLAHDHAERAGCRIRRDLVESVASVPDGGFRIDPQEGEPTTARFVIAATKYDAEYLRGLDADAMFVTEERDDESGQRFDRDYPDDDGRTPIDGLYVAGPLAGGGDQAIVAAGHGATVARALLEDRRREEGYWGRFATHYDWRRKAADRRPEWSDPERWLESLEASAPTAREPATVRRLAESAAEERDEQYVTADVAASRAERGQRRLAAALDDEILLEALDDETIVEYAASLERSGSSADR